MMSLIVGSVKTTSFCDLIKANNRNSLSSSPLLEHTSPSLGRHRNVLKLRQLNRRRVNVTGLQYAAAPENTTNEKALTRGRSNRFSTENSRNNRVGQQQ